MTPLLATFVALMAQAPSATKTVVSPGLSAQINAGFPWSGVVVKQPLKRQLTVLLEAETALARRWESRLGLQRHWDLGASWRVGLGAGAGWVYQNPSVPRQGVQGFGRASLTYQTRYRPWLALDYRRLTSLREWVIQSAQGTRREWRTTPFTSLLAQLGAVVPLHRSWALGVQFIFGEMDGVFAIPGASLGLQWRAP